MAMPGVRWAGPGDLPGVDLVDVDAITAEFVSGWPSRLTWSGPGGVERVTRIELASSAWEAGVLPLNYTRGSRQRSDQGGLIAVGRLVVPTRWVLRPTLRCGLPHRRGSPAVTGCSRSPCPHAVPSRRPRCSRRHCRCSPAGPRGRRRRSGRAQLLVAPPAVSLTSPSSSGPTTSWDLFACLRDFGGWPRR